MAVRWSVVSPIAMLIAVCGCRTYESASFDIAAHDAAWAARTPASPSARELAERLATAEGRSSEFDPSDGLTLAEAEPMALLFNPDLRVRRLAAGVARAVADHAGTWEDPVLGVEFERILDAGGKPWSVAPSLGITIPVSGRLGAQKDQAAHELNADLARVAALEWKVRSELRVRWTEWSAQRLRADLARELSDRLDAMGGIADRFEAAGEIARVDARLLRVERASRRAEVESAAAHAAELEMDVRGLMGLRPDVPVALVPDFYRAPDGDLEDTGSSKVDARNPELLAATLAAKSADAAVRVEIRKQYPDITLTPGYQSEPDDSRFLFGLSLPLPLWNRNQLGVEHALAERARALETVAAVREGLLIQFARTRARFQAARSARTALETNVVPLADEQIADAQRIADLGEVDVLLQLETLNVHHAVKLRLVDAHLAESLAAAKFEELLGPPAAERIEGETP